MRRQPGSLGLLLIVCLVASLFGASLAQASTSYVSAGSLGDGAVGTPTRIAVEESTGNVLVVDSVGKVNVFDSSGPGAALLTSFGEGQLGGAYGIAVDQTDGDVYVTDPVNEEIARYETDGAEPPTYTLDAGYTSPAAGSGAEEVGSFSSPIAIDPTNGDLLVGDRGNLSVKRFSSSGAFLSGFDGSDTTVGAFGSLLDIAARDDGGVCVVADGTVEFFESVVGSRVECFAADGTTDGSIGTPETVGSARSVAFDSFSGYLFLGTGGGAFGTGGPATLKYFDEGSPAGEFTYAGNPSSAPVGLAAAGATSKRVYGLTSTVFFGSDGSAAVQVFARIFRPTLEAPTEITITSAKLTGAVNPEGQAGTHYRFEYAKQGSEAWKLGFEGEAGTGEAPETVESTLSGLEPNTAYEARLAFSNDEASATSPSRSFNTSAAAPTAITKAASGISGTSSTIFGNVNPHGLQTRYYFEYGTTTGYGSRTPADHDDVIGNGRSLVAVSAELVDLEPGSTYHYRLVATNSFGTSYGDDESFFSAAGKERAYELVSPAEKKGSNVKERLGFQSSENGDMLSYVGLASLGGGTEAGPLFPRYVSRRSATGWSFAPTDPPLGVGLNGLGVLTFGISEDGTKAIVMSYRALAPGAVEGFSNIYLRDVGSNHYTTIATNPDLEWSKRQTGLPNIAGPLFVQGTADFSHILISSAQAGGTSFLPGVPVGALYDFTDGQLEVASILPDGTTGIGTGRGFDERGLNRMSRDGSRIIFGSAGSALYLRENGVTRPLTASRKSGEEEGDLMGGSFVGADLDLKRIYFMSRDLTDDSVPGALTLYSYETETDELDMLVQVEKSETVEKAYGLQVSKNGRAAYFTSELLLTPDATQERNIYVWHDDELSLVASMELAYNPLSRGARTWWVSPSGRYLVFTASQPGLAGYDSKNGACPQGSEKAACREIYRYDLEANKVICASCPVDGSKPTGNADIGEMFAEGGVVAFPRAVNDAGDVFFDTPERLVGSDTNSVRDVYEYSDTGGQRLISTGQGAFAQLAEVDADGSNVFFTTTDQLVGIDQDHSIDVYDARVGGGIPSQNPDPPGACGVGPCRHPEPTVPPAASLGSEANSGLGNKRAKRCGKGKHLQRKAGKKKCVRKAKANRNRRQSR